MTDAFRNQVLVGDCVRSLDALPAGIAQTCVTSFPYWGLRDYGVHDDPDAIGLEPTLDQHLDNVLRVSRSVRRSLRDDGTYWVNYGDAYASDAGPRNEGSSDGWLRRGDPPGGRPRAVSGFKNKDLMGLAWRVAFALQADGWHLRSDIIWHKPNAMPESVSDRPARAHEYLFLFAKSADPLLWTHPRRSGVRAKPEPDYVWRRREDGVVVEELPSPPPGWEAGDKEARETWKRSNLWVGRDYFYDAEAVKVEASGTAHARGKGVNPKSLKAWPPIGGGLDEARAHGANRQAVKRTPMQVTTKPLANADFQSKTNAVLPVRNLRDVWEIPSQPYEEAHFATFPEALVEPCIKAGTSQAGQCPACGAPWFRLLERKAYGDWNSRKTTDQRVKRADKDSVARWRGGTYQGPETVGWAPTCSCDAGDPIPQIVLDPFGGSGTVGVAAKGLGRDFLLCELNPDFAAMAQRRLSPVMNHRLDKQWSPQA